MGERRIGLAIADRDGGRALPLSTLKRKSSTDEDAVAFAGVVAEHDVDELVVGLPLHAGGDEGSQAAATRAWAAAVARMLGLPVTFRDERLTSHFQRHLAVLRRIDDVEWDLSVGHLIGRIEHTQAEARHKQPLD